MAAMTSILKKVNWKVYVILLVAGLLGVVAVLPYAFELVGSGIMKDAPAPEIPFVLIHSVGNVQNGIILSATILIGLIFPSASDYECL